MKILHYSFFTLLGISTLFLLGCDSPQNVHLGDTVNIEYTSAFTDGSDFQTTGASFVVGSGQIIAGLDNGVLGMKAGQTKKITVAPTQGYGNLYNAFKLQKISKILFDKMTAGTGTTSGIMTIAGVKGVIKGVEKDADGNDVVLFDINPRETRDTIIFMVKLISKK